MPETTRSVKWENEISDEFIAAAHSFTANVSQAIYNNYEPCPEVLSVANGHYKSEDNNNFCCILVFYQFIFGN